MKANTKKNTHLQAAQAQAQSKACKRVFFSATCEKLFFKIFSPSENKKYATAQTNTTQTMTVKLNIDNGLHGGQTEGLLLTRCCRNGGRRAKLNGSISNQLWCLADSDGILIPPLRQHPNRCRQLPKK